MIGMCMRWSAAFCVSPCCYGRVSQLKLPRSGAFGGHVTAQQSLLLAHAADITPWDKESAQVGKQCMNLTDWDRKLQCEEEGYTVTLYSMNPYDCTPKNNFIFGRK